MHDAQLIIEECFETENKKLKLSGMELKEIPIIPPHVIQFICARNLLESLPELPSHLRLLQCFHNNLKSLPELPDTLTFLSTNRNQLTQLPDLPNPLAFLFCSRNCLIELPELPDRLLFLHCSTNKLIKLPKLPDRLRSLNCSHNNLISLPELPAGLRTLKCKDNPYLQVPENIATRFGIAKTPNYGTIMQELKKMRNAWKRKERLIHCEKLQIGIDSYLYRPDGTGYNNVKESNKGKWLDVLKNLIYLIIHSFFSEHLLTQEWDLPFLFFWIEIHVGRKIGICRKNCLCT